MSDAQLKWHDVSAHYGPLPPSVQIFMSTDSVDGKPNRSFYVSAQLNDPRLIFTTQISKGGRLTPSQFFAQEDSPLVVVNGTFFSFADNRNLNIVMRDGQQLAYNITSVKGKKDSLYTYITRGAIGINRKKKADVAWVYTDSSGKKPLAFEKNPVTNTKGVLPDAGRKHMKKRRLHNPPDKPGIWNMETAIGGGPVLVQNGKVRITNSEEIMFVNGADDRHPRTTMGYTYDGRLIILMVEGRNPGVAEGMSLRQQAEAMVALGCKEALNLDGGGSSTLLMHGRETIKPSDKEGQRPVPAVFLIYQKKQ